jgi:hypothetical protein
MKQWEKRGFRRTAQTQFRTANTPKLQEGCPATPKDSAVARAVWEVNIRGDSHVNYNKYSKTWL